MSLTRTRFPLVAALVTLTLACSGGEDGSNENLAQGGGTVPGDSAVLSTVEPAQLDDAQVAAILSAADSSEILPSEIALESAQASQLREFAERMVQEHGALTDSLAAITSAAGITPRPNRESDLLHTQTQATVEALRAHEGAAFDSAYAAAMVQSHEVALNLIDSQLLDGTSDARLRTAIETRVRPAVAAHLEQIRQIQSTLSSP